MLLGSFVQRSYVQRGVLLGILAACKCLNGIFAAEQGDCWTAGLLPAKKSASSDIINKQKAHFSECSFDPLWNSLVVAGVQPDGSPFCGMVSMIGVHYDDSCICTGFASHLALPLLRDAHSAEMSEADADKLMKDALRVGIRYLAAATALPGVCG